MVSPWQSAVAAMIRSGCEKVCPALRPSSTRSPFEHDIFADGQDALLIGRTLCASQSLFGAPAGVGNEFDAEADFGEGTRWQP
jgi:hypothetical protein